MTVLSPRFTLAVVAIGIAVALAAALAPDFAVGPVHLRHVLSAIAGTCSWLAGAGRSFVRSVDHPPPKEITMTLDALFAALRPAAKPMAEAAVAQLEARKPEILAALSGTNVRLAAAIEAELASALKSDAHLGPFAGFLDASALASEAEAALVREAGSAEAAAFDLAAARLKAFADSL